MADRAALPQEAPYPAVVSSSISTIAEETRAPAPDRGDLVSQRRRYQPTTEELDSYKLLSKSQLDFLLGPEGFTNLTALLFSGQSVFGLKPFGNLPTERDLAPYKNKLGPAIHPAILAHFEDQVSLELATAILIWGIGKLERRIVPVLESNKELAQQNSILAGEKHGFLIELERLNLMYGHQVEILALKERQIETATRDRNMLQRSFNSFAEKQIKNAVVAERLAHKLQLSKLQTENQAVIEGLQKQILELKVQNDTLSREKGYRDEILAEALENVEDLKKQINERDCSLAALKEEVETHEKQKERKALKTAAVVSASTQAKSERIELEDVTAPPSSDTEAQSPLLNCARTHIVRNEKWLYCLFFLIAMAVWTRLGYQFQTPSVSGSSVSPVPCPQSNDTALAVTGSGKCSNPHSSIAEGCS